MLTLAHLILAACAPLALSTSSCVRVDNTSAGANSNAMAAAVASADVVVLSPDDGGDDELSVMRRLDRAGRGGDGQLPQLTPDEHMRRAAVYHANRAFKEARDHWQAVLTRHPDDAKVPEALFGMGRSLFQERHYEEALPYFERLENYTHTEAGRDGYYYVAATKLRLGRAGEAVQRYAEYIERFPEGERVEAAYLNVIDSLREAGRPGEAIPWVERTRQKFPNTPTAANALFARLRLEVAGGDWLAAAKTSDEMSRVSLSRDVNTTRAELAYLRAFSLERSGHKDGAIRAYQMIADTPGSYYGWLATERMRALGARDAAAARESRVRADIVRRAAEYPAPNREALLRATSGRSVDPRLLLAIMKQESQFNPQAKSRAGARGLMQFTPDTAAKYVRAAGLSSVTENDLFRPDVSIALAGAYIQELLGMFPGLPEAAAASYNGGEDNVARWVKRKGHDDPGIFTAEVGFTESKDYVVRVMSNYRAYKLLYTEDLRPRR
ncbi:MAG TPA: transglycosylase SLT domain-containing protein [Pyrinomonadaceae bacterium]|nr:transglycosylase SLT domain-containing protein [Pyrinomonadaceae bacterium]